MAVITSYNSGLRRIEFFLTPNGPRKIIRLGRMSKAAAESIKSKVEAIVGDLLANRPHDAEVSKWLGGLSETMLARFRRAGLADGVGLAHVTLGTFMDRFFASLGGKPATRISYGNVRRNLELYFTASRAIRSITAADADAWRAWLAADQKLGSATVSRRVIAARTMWKKAVRWKLVNENVFEGVKAGQQVNEARKFFVSREVADAVMQACPDAQWKLIFALSRYGGLRCPSEHLAMRWQDVDFDRHRIVVHSPKTEHHEGGATRTIPMFKELEKPLVDAFAEAPEGSVYVIQCRNPGVNWRTQLQRIIRKAKVEEWPKLFHNLRASRESELMREYDLATVCKWIGNSPAVAAKHYAVSVDLDSDFRRATGLETGAAKSAAVSPRKPESASDRGESKNAETPENRGSGECCHAGTNADNTGEWAIQDSNL